MEAAGVLALSGALACAGGAGWSLGRWVQTIASEWSRQNKAAGVGSRYALRFAIAGFGEKAARRLACIPKASALLEASRIAHRRKQIVKQLPQAIRLLCISLDSGSSLMKALEYAAENSTGAMSAELKKAVWDFHAGQSFEEAMEGLRSRTGGAEFSCLAVAMEIQHRCGGTLSSILKNLSQMLQESSDLEEDLVTKTSQARLSARVVAIMPVVIVVLLSLASPGYLLQFFQSVGGVVLLFMAAILEVAGMVLVKRSLAIDMSLGASEP